VTRWRPRASAIGYYASCHYRAAFDRAFHEEVAGAEVAAAIAEKEAKPSPYADLGTCIHFILQDGLRCVWGTGTSKDHAPTDEQWANAKTLFDPLFDIKAHTLKVATFAAKYLPKPSDEKPWICEIGYKARDVQGHIDFLSQNGEDLWDLKTTSRKPDHNRIKAPHLAQLITYQILAKTPKRGGILYVDSLRGDWAVPCPVDFESEGMLEYIGHVKSLLSYLRSPKLFANAIPQIGATCSDDFCPFVELCKNRYLPGPAELHAASPVHTTPITAGKVF
jgi:hypothetical protein